MTGVWIGEPANVSLTFADTVVEVWNISPVIGSDQLNSGVSRGSVPVDAQYLAPAASQTTENETWQVRMINKLFDYCRKQEP